MSGYGTVQKTFVVTLSVQEDPSDLRDFDERMNLWIREHSVPGSTHKRTYLPPVAIVSSGTRPCVMLIAVEEYVPNPESAKK